MRAFALGLAFGTCNAKTILEREKSLEEGAMGVQWQAGALALLAGMTLAHAQNAATASAAPAQPSAANTPQTFTVPAGTKVLLSLKSAINTKTAQQGDGVYLISSFPVVGNARVMIPVGVYVQGVVDRVVRPGRVKGRAQLDLHFTTMIFPNGQIVAVPGVLNSLPGSDGPKVKGNEGTVEQAGNKGRDIGNIVKGAAIGAEGGVIGGAATGEVAKGVGYGSLAGAAAGTIYTLFTRGDDIVIPTGTSVEMVLQRPLVLQESQLAGLDESRGQAQLVPGSNQQQPLPKRKQRILCPFGSPGCD
jgi:type IV secretion system protein VirB10